MHSSFTVSGQQEECGGRRMGTFTIRHCDGDTATHVCHRLERKSQQAFISPTLCDWYAPSSCVWFRRWDLWSRLDVCLTHSQRCILSGCKSCQTSGSTATPPKRSGGRADHLLHVVESLLPANVVPPLVPRHLSHWHLIIESFSFSCSMRSSN